MALTWFDTVFNALISKSQVIFSTQSSEFNAKISHLVTFSIQAYNTRLVKFGAEEAEFTLSFSHIVSTSLFIEYCQFKSQSFNQSSRNLHWYFHFILEFECTKSRQFLVISTLISMYQLEDATTLTPQTLSNWEKILSWRSRAISQWCWLLRVLCSSLRAVLPKWL